MKRVTKVLIIAMLVLMVTLATGVYAVGTASIALVANATQLQAGSTATVSVIASGSAQIRGGEFNASIDSSNFEIVSVGNAGIFSVSGNGGYYLSYNMAGNAAASGSSIATITVKAKAGAPAGSIGTLTVSGAGVVLKGDEGNTVSAASRTVTFSVKETSTNSGGGNSGGSVTPTTKPATQTSPTTQEDSNAKANANLKSLTSDITSIGFNANTTEYTVNVNKTISSLGLKAIAENSKAKITITGDENFKTGNNVITIKVVSEDGTVTKTYTITVIKSKFGAGALASLKVEEFELLPEFDPSILEYKVTIDGSSDATSLKLTCVPTNADATVTVEGNENFVVGKNIVTITVTEKNGTVTVYKIEVIKEPAAIEKVTSIAKKNNTLWIIIVIILIVSIAAETVYIVIKRKKERKQ